MKLFLVRRWEYNYLITTSIKSPVIHDPLQFINKRKQNLSLCDVNILYMYVCMCVCVCVVCVCSLGWSFGRLTNETMGVKSSEKTLKASIVCFQGYSSLLSFIPSTELMSIFFQIFLCLFFRRIALMGFRCKERK